MFTNNTDFINRAEGVVSGKKERVPFMQESGIQNVDITTSKYTKPMIQC